MTSSQEQFKAFIAVVMKLLDAASVAGQENSNDIAAKNLRDLCRSYEALRVPVEVSREEIERGVRAMLFDDDMHDAWMAAVEWIDGPIRDDARVHVEQAYNAWCFQRYPFSKEESLDGEST